MTFSPLEIIEKLLPLNRTLLAPDNRKALDILKGQIPLNVYGFPSGTKCFDWIVPKEWSCNHAKLQDARGRVIIDTEVGGILQLLNYSDSFTGLVKGVDLLRNNIFCSESIDRQSVPYRTSYYSKNWGFCVSKEQLESITPQESYIVDIDCSFKDGHLLIGESSIESNCSSKDVILTSYYCHPSQANDGLSGVALLVQLYRYLSKAKQEGWKPKYNYRFYFWPETIGAISALSKGLISPNNVEYALVATTVGYGDTIHYKKTYLGDHSLDNIVEDTLNCKIRDFCPTGSDERQFSSKGIKIPCGVLTATPYQRYPQYHTSHDNLGLVSNFTLHKMCKAYRQVIFAYEGYDKCSTVVEGCEPFLSKYNCYREISKPGHSDEESLRNWVLYYSDGTRNIKDISKKLGCREVDIRDIYSDLKSKGVVV